MNYCDSLYTVPRAKLNANAIIEPDSSTKVSYLELQNRVRTFAAVLNMSGVNSGDTVVIHLYNNIDAVVAHMAVQFTGAVSCLIDPLIQPKSLSYYTDETDAKMLITHRSEDQIPSEIRKKRSVITAETIESSSTVLLSEESEMHNWDENEICFIYYTSGTTSVPKGVTLTLANHENFFKVSEQYGQAVDGNSKHICFVPLSHGFGSIHVLPVSLRNYAELYILRSFHPGKVAEIIDTYDITHIYGVPSHYQQLLRFPNFHSSLTKLKAAFCAAAKLEIETMDLWKEVTGFYLDEGYGLIETSTGIVNRVGIRPRSTGHVGECPDPAFIEIGILDENGAALAIGKEGEISVRGKSIMAGYLNKAEENANVFINGWFKTGDRGYISEDNQLFMTGRIKDIINIAGIKISPYEVEAVLNNHPAVSESVVVAAEDTLYGEVVKAHVLLHKDTTLTERELIRYASELLINFQVPKIVEFVENFPTNNMGKIDRKALRTI